LTFNIGSIEIPWRCNPSRKGVGPHQAKGWRWRWWRGRRM